MISLIDTSKKLSMATKAVLFPEFSRAFVYKLSKVLLLTSVGTSTAFAASPGWAVTVAPTNIVVRIPGTAGGTDESQNTQADNSTVTYTGLGGTSGSGAVLSGSTQGNAFVDDVLLESVTFGGTTLSNLRAAQPGRAVVTTRRAGISATYGDSDTNSDNNDTPFAKIGSTVTVTGTAVPPQTNAEQDAAIAAAYGSLSLTEGISSIGQSGGAGLVDYSFNLLFQNGITDSSSAVDNLPELVIFERGALNSTQSDYTVQAIVGGTLYNPTFAPTTVTVLRTNQTPSGIVINTADSGNAEPLNIAGIDLNEFGIAADQVVYGINFTSINGSGADIFGLTLTAATAAQVNNVQTVPVPEPSTIFGSAIALLFAALAFKIQAKKEVESRE